MNFYWTLAGNLVYATCQWGMLVVLAKLGSVEMVGLLALGIAMTSPVIALTGLQLRAIQATDARGEYRFGDYLGLRMLMTSVALVLIGLAAWGYHAEARLTILAVGLAKAVESISDVIFGLLQQHERMDRIARSMMIKGLLSLTVLATVVAATGSVFLSMLATAGAWGVVLVLYDIPSAIRVFAMMAPGDRAASLAVIRPQFRRGALTRLAWTALPLGIVMMLLSINLNIPRYFVEHQGGEYELGILAALAYLTTAGNQVVNALGQSASPRLSQYHAAGNVAAFRRLLVRLVVVNLSMGGLGIAAALIAGRELLGILYRPEYAEHGAVFVWIMIGGAVSYLGSAFGYAATSRRQLTLQPMAVLTTTATSLLASWLLIPHWGMQGAAWSMVISSTVCASGYAWLAWKSE